MTTITVIAIVADETTITLYKDDGEQLVLKSSEYRTQQIVDLIMPDIAAHRKAKVDITQYQIYGKFEEKSGGLVRFFRMAKTKVASLFGVEPQKTKTTTETESSAPVHEPAPKITVAQVEAQGSKDIPMELDEADTVVAVIGTGEKAKAIPHMEKLQTQFQNSVSGSEKGMVRFLERIAAVIDQRGHSVEDMLKFLEKADLPIADDGSVIAYKVLKKFNDNKYADCHTGKVVQHVGSHVFMDPKMVDPSRHADCSHGLHIARRDYIKGFRGDVIVLCKINPEDFIAVPRYDPSKVRVCGYHIIFEVPKAGRDLLRSNRPMTNDDASAKMLGAAIAGDHIGVIETVEIKGEKGTNLVVTPIADIKSVKTAPSRMTAAKVSALNTDASKSDQPPVQGLSPKELHDKADKIRKDEEAKKAKETKAEIIDSVVDSKAKEPVSEEVVQAASGKNVNMSKADQVKALFRNWAESGNKAAFEDMLDIKKKSKKSWSALGLEPHQQQAVEKHLTKK